MDMDSREYYRYSIFARASILVKNEIDSVAIKTEVSNIAETGLGAYSADIEGKVVWLSMEGDIYYAGIFFDEELNPDKQPNLYWHFHRIIKDD
jgi:hypothetical protein